MIYFCIASPTLQIWFSCHHYMIFFLHFEKITKKKLQKSLAGFYKIEPASYREIKLYLTAKKYSYDKRKQESKQVVGFQIFFDSIFVWFISSRSWNLIFLFLNCYYNPSPHRLFKPMVPLLTWFKHLSLFLCQQEDSLSVFDLWPWSSSGQLCGFSP